MANDQSRIPRSVSRAMQSEQELPWLFNRADGEVSGLVASHGALVEMSQTGAARAGPGTTGIPQRVQGISARQADAVDRQRGMRERLQQLCRRHQEVLWLAYGPRDWSLAPDERQRLGAPWHGVALVTESAARGWAAELRRRAQEAGSRDDRELLEADRFGGERLLAWRRGANAGAAVEQWFARGIGYWLRGPAVDGALLAAVREEAERLVAESWRAWSAAEVPRGTRRPDWEGQRNDGGERTERTSETRIIAPRFEPAPMPKARAFGGRGGL